MSSPEAHVAVLHRCVVSRVRDDVDLDVMVVLETQSASLISKLDAIAVKPKEHRFAATDCRVDRGDPGIFIYKAPVGQCLLRCGEA